MTVTGNCADPIGDTKMKITVETREGLQIARHGNYLICDINDRPIRVAKTLTNGLGRIYQLDRNGNWHRVIF